MRWTRMILTAAVAALVAAPAAHAETYTVIGTADVPGVCDGTACTSIRQALASALRTRAPTPSSSPRAPTS